MKWHHLMGALCFATVSLAPHHAEADEKEDKKPLQPEAAQPPKEVAGHVFAWPFLEAGKMQPRGGSSRGGEVTLVTEPKDSWKRLQETGLSKFERDRRAILAMAGSYRVSFDFVETLGFGGGYKPPKPYFSWGTEHVSVIEDTGKFVSLQHVLIMFFKDAEGKETGPHVMKHWRQDWTWEDRDLHVYDKDQTWVRNRPEEVAGKWSQAVFQVDDSPRYEVLGEWTHDGGVSSWKSESCPRPLPRREHSVRNDYNVLEGTHEITISPSGWLHVQNNRKVKIDADRSRHVVGLELGVDRYEEISSPDLEAAYRNYWSKTGGYWAAVRAVWRDVFKEQERFVISEKEGEAPLFTVHFGYAADLEKSSEAVDPGAGEKHARETVDRFLRKASAE